MEVRTKPEGLQSCSVQHDKASTHKELLVGLIPNVVRLIDPSELDTRRLLQAEQVRHLRAHSLIETVLGKRKTTQQFSDGHPYLTNVLCDVFIPEDDEES